MEIQGWKHYEDKIGFLINLFGAWAYLHGYELNPSPVRVAKLLKYMLLRDEDYGMWFCPSQPVLGDAELDLTIACPCVYAVEDIEVNGSCNCGLFVRGSTIDDEEAR